MNKKISYQEKMRSKLNHVFAPTELVIRDDSAQHAGHSGAHPDGETHFHIIIRAPIFADMNRVARQRAVMKAVQDELNEHVHALSLDVDG